MISPVTDCELPQPLITQCNEFLFNNLERAARITFEQGEFTGNVLLFDRKTIFM